MWNGEEGDFYLNCISSCKWKKGKKLPSRLSPEKRRKKWGNKEIKGKNKTFFPQRDPAYFHVQYMGGKWRLFLSKLNQSRIYSARGETRGGAGVKCLAFPPPPPRPV